MLNELFLFLLKYVFDIDIRILEVCLFYRFLNLVYIFFCNGNYWFVGFLFMLGKSFMILLCVYYKCFL